MEVLNFINDASNLINSIEKEINANMKKEFNITLEEVIILDKIFINDNISITQLKKEIIAQQTTANGKIKDLTKKGYINKSRSLIDERIVHLNISRKGLVIYGKATEYLENNLKEYIHIKQFIDKYCKQ